MSGPQVIEIVQYIDDENWEEGEEKGFLGSSHEEEEVIEIKQVQVVVPTLLRRRSSVTIAPHEVGIGQQLNEIIVESSHGTRYHQKYKCYYDDEGQDDEEEEAGKGMFASFYCQQEEKEDKAGDVMGIFRDSNANTSTTTSASYLEESEGAPTEMEKMFAAHMETVFANHKAQILQNENTSLRGLVQSQADQIKQLQKNLQEKVERLAMVELELDLCRADNQALLFQQQQQQQQQLQQQQQWVVGDGRMGGNLTSSSEASSSEAEVRKREHSDPAFQPDNEASKNTKTAREDQQTTPKSSGGKVDRWAMLEQELDLCRAENQAFLQQEQATEQQQQQQQHKRRAAFFNNSFSGHQADEEVSALTSTGPAQGMGVQVSRNVLFEDDYYGNPAYVNENEREEDYYKEAQYSHGHEPIISDEDEIREYGEGEESPEDKALREQMEAELAELDRQIEEAKIEKKRRESMVATSSTVETTPAQGPVVNEKVEVMIAKTTTTATATKTTTTTPKTTVGATTKQVLMRVDSTTSRTSRCSSDESDDVGPPIMLAALSARASMRVSLVAAKAVKKLRERLVTAQLKQRLKEHAQKKKKEAAVAAAAATMDQSWQEIIGSIRTARKSLKPLPKSLKRDSSTWINNDHPYMRELREVQAEVLPMWRKETYDYWI